MKRADGEEARVSGPKSLLLSDIERRDGKTCDQAWIQTASFLAQLTQTHPHTHTHTHRCTLSPNSELERGINRHIRKESFAMATGLARKRGHGFLCGAERCTEAEWCMSARERECVCVGQPLSTPQQGERSESCC